MGKTKFTCTEHFGNEDANELILEPLIHYINKKAGKTVVRLKKSKASKRIIQPVRATLKPRENIKLK